MACWSRVTHDWVPIDAVNLNTECDAIVQAHSEGVRKKENSCLMLEASISTRTDKLATCYSMVFNERSRYTLLSR